jgi:hypothetical protein
MCEQQYFIEYVLGWRGSSNKKADKGTITHKILEILALIKKHEQLSTQVFIDDVVGEININHYDFDQIINDVYNFYSKQFTQHEWSKKDFEDCKQWAYKAINFNNGMFDPRNRNIFSSEQHFDFIIDKPWAEYEYDTPDGKLSGKLAVKGTIDLITDVGNNTLEVIDWKTGRRLDWSSGQEKTHAKLETDPQLMIYHYAVSKLFPQYDHIIVTIYFINDGGPFSILFDKASLSKTEDMLRQKFEIIKKTKKPRLNKTWMCSKLCHFGKTTFEDSSSILPILEYRDNQSCSSGLHMTKCEQIKHDIEIKGINQVVQEYKNPGHSFGKYKAPGSAE